MITRIVVCLAFAMVVSAVKFERTDDRRCEACPSRDGHVSLEGHVCGEDGNTYPSLCDLRREGCLQEKRIQFACKGRCPCDPAGVYKLDPETVQQLRQMRTRVQMEEIITEIKTDEQEDWEQKRMPAMRVFAPKKSHVIPDLDTNPSPRCSVEEMRRLPSRLVDWFHVLKTNERRQKLTEINMSTKSILKEMSFVEAKLKSLYSQLACTLQEDDGENVCFTPVRWMFEHMDANADGSLSDDELFEIEEINSEQCIKPFLTRCDTNRDGEVLLKEFCKCLCVEPPCTKMMRLVPASMTAGGQVVVPSERTFKPRCDEDGFFMPTQCHNNQCWCADRNGAEYLGTRKDGDQPTCEDNTELHAMTFKTKPLDYKTENMM